MRRRSGERVTPDTPALPPRHERPLFAIGLRLIAVALLSISFALGKIVAERGAHIVEILFYRQLFALPLVAAWIFWATGALNVRTDRPWSHATRAALGLIGMSLNFGSMILLPLPEATVIGFTMPVFATIFSALILREATGWHRWSAVVVGFLGVLLVVRPDTDHIATLGLAVAIAAAVITALISIFLRQLSRTEDSAVIVFWFSALSIPPLLGGMAIVGRTHDPLTWWLLLALGLSGGLAQLFLTSALRWGPVAVVLTMDYSALLWATAFGAILWNYWPQANSWAGTLLIVGAGLYIAWREHRNHRALRDAASAATTG